VPKGVVSRDQPATIEASLRGAVAIALATLSPPWAVRSSSTAEDSEAAAFAGVFKTVLGLRTADAVLDAILAVAESASSPLVHAYATAKGIGDSDIEMSVLIQELADAEVSGVAFSVHPITSEPVVVVESNFGYGDSVVDGSVTPDRFVVSVDERVIVERIGSKLEQSNLTPHGVARIPTPLELRSRPSLNLGEVKDLARIVRGIVAELGQPQDVEWVRTSDGFVITQARPITTLTSTLLT
jgi:pyruvate,water dikinase